VGSCKTTNSRSAAPCPGKNGWAASKLLRVASARCPLSAYHHLQWVSFPVFIVLAWLVRGPGRANAGIIAALAALALLFLIPVAWRVQHSVCATMRLIVGNVAFRDRDYYDQCAWLASRTRPNESIKVGQIKLTKRSSCGMSTRADTASLCGRRLATGNNSLHSGSLGEGTGRLGLCFGGRALLKPRSSLWWSSFAAAPLLAGHT